MHRIGTGIAFALATLITGWGCGSSESTPATTAPSTPDPFTPDPGAGEGGARGETRPSGGGGDEATGGSSSAGGAGGEAGGRPSLGDCDTLTGWQPLGAPLNALTGPDTHARGPHVTLFQGDPVVAWHEGPDPTGSADEIFVRRWDGAAWQAMGAAVRVAGVDFTSSAKLIADGGELYLAFTEADGQTHLFIYRWSGSDWVSVGSPSTALGIASSVAHDTIVDDQGALVAAWMSRGSVRVARRDGGTWSLLGSPLSYPDGSPPVLFTQLWLEPSGDLNVAYTGGIGTHFARFDGTEWVPAFAPHPARMLGIVAASGGPVFGGREGAQPGTVRVHQWDGAWQASPALNVHPSGLIARAPALVLAPGGVVAAWTERDPQLAFRTYAAYIVDGTAFPLEGLDDEEAAGWNPAVAIDSCDRPIVAWAGAASPGGDPPIFVRRYHGP